ncbi:MAG: transcriptional repressor [Myxococcota bacterium]
MSEVSELKAAFFDFSRRRALKATSQREAIVDSFFRAGGHMSADALLEKVRRKNPRVGYATVYRTLKLLCEAGLANERRFGAGFALYEKAGPHHHDHLICTGCGRISEFENDEIEHLQDEVARKHEFTITHHKHEIYGLCASCQSKR